MSFGKLWQRLFQSPKPGPRRPRPAALLLESLENREVPSTITWTNRGQASDNFAAVFGTNANLARSVVDTAIGEWTAVISNFNQSGGGNNIDATITMNTAAGSSGGSTNVTFGSDNKPRSASISLGRTGDGTNAWYLNPTLFTSDFLGTPSNAFAGYAQAGSAAAGKADFLEVVTHELGHAMGFESDTRVNALAHDTGVADNSSGGGIGHYYAFVGTGGFRCLLTSFNSGNPGTDAHGGEHFASGGSLTYGGNSYDGADDLMTPYYGNGQRRIVSRNDAFVLRDAMGYTVNDPATVLGTFYAVLDENGHLTVRGRQDAASIDTLTVDTVNGNSFLQTTVSLGTPVPGTDYTTPYIANFYTPAIRSIETDTGTGWSSVNLQHTPNVPITVNGNGLILIALGSGGNAQGVQGSITLNSPDGAGSLFVDNSSDQGNHTITMNDTGGTTFGQITGLTPATVHYRNSQLDDVTLKTGTGPNTVNLYATNLGGVVSLEGHGSTTVNVGNGTTQNIRAGVDITNPPYLTTLNVNDSADPGSRTTTVGNWSFLGYGAITGLFSTSAVGIYYKYDDTSAVTVKTGTGSNAVNVTEVAKPLTVEGHSDTTTVGVGKNGSLAGIQAGLTITDPSFVTHPRVTVDDSADTASRSVSVGGLGLTGLSPAPITFGSAGIATLTVTGGSGNNSYTLSFLPDVTTLNTGTGNDRVDIQSMGDYSLLGVNFGGGLNTVNVGSTGNTLDAVKGLVSVDSLTGYTILNLNDQGTAAVQGYTVTAADVTWGNGRPRVSYDLAAGTLTINGGRGDNTFMVTGTSVPTTIYGGSGNDTVNVLATTANLGIDAHGGVNAVNLGNAGSVQGIRGHVFVTETGGTTQLAVDDSADPAGRAVTLAADASGVTGYVRGLAPAEIQYTQLAALTVTGASGATTFTVTGTLVPTTIYGGNGNDTVNALATTANLGIDAHGGVNVVNLGNAGSVQDIRGHVFVTETGGTTQLAVDDSADPNPRTVALDTGYPDVGYVRNLGPAEIQYTNIATLIVYGSAGGNTFDVTNGNAGSTQMFLYGSGAADTLIGPNYPDLWGNFWSIDGADTGTLSGPYFTQPAYFSGFGNLTSGTGADTFVFADGATLSGNITGGGADSLDYTAYSTSVVVDLQTGQATGVGGSVSGIGTVYGGNGNGDAGAYNLLVGNGGNTLIGGSGRSNLLIAGGSASTLVGGGSDDLLIGGTTAYDQEAGLASLQAIMDYWTGSGDDYATRVSNLTSGNGVPLLDATTVTGNGGGNTLYGNGGLDLYFGNLDLDTYDWNPDTQTFVQV